MKLAVFGATGNTGRATVANALASAASTIGRQTSTTATTTTTDHHCRHQARNLSSKSISPSLKSSKLTSMSIVPSATMANFFTTSPVTAINFSRLHMKRSAFRRSTTSSSSSSTLKGIAADMINNNITSSNNKVDQAEGDFVTLERLTNEQEGIVVVGLNRPRAKNAFDRRMTAHMSTLFAELHDDPAVRVVILRSHVSGVFCAGADLKERASIPESEVSGVVAKLRRTLTQFNDLPCPTIAALDGVALGGGLELALAADLRIVASSAKMGLVETKLAIIPGAGGTQRLPRLVGAAKAKELMFTGRTVSGDEAGRLGLANHVVDQNEQGDSAFRHALQMAEEITAHGPLAVRMVKRAVDLGLQTDLATGLTIEEACYARIVPTKDRLEGLAAFREKRIPKFKGN